jgi:hypothetical protein
MSRTFGFVLARRTQRSVSLKCSATSSRMLPKLWGGQPARGSFMIIVALVGRAGAA